MSMDDIYKTTETAAHRGESEPAVEPEDCTTCQGDGYLVGDDTANGRDFDRIAPCHACQGDGQERLDDYADFRADAVLINPPPMATVADAIFAQLRTYTVIPRRAS